MAEAIPYLTLGKHGQPLLVTKSRRPRWKPCVRVHAHRNTVASWVRWYGKSRAPTRIPHATLLEIHRAWESLKVLTKDADSTACTTKSSKP